MGGKKKKKKKKSSSTAELGKDRKVNSINHEQKQPIQPPSAALLSQRFSKVEPNAFMSSCDGHGIFYLIGIFPRLPRVRQSPLHQTGASNSPNNPNNPNNPAVSQRTSQTDTKDHSLYDVAVLTLLTGTEVTTSLS